MDNRVHIKKNMNHLIKIVLFIVAMPLITSCVVSRAIRYGNAAIDDYTVFEQDTVQRGAQTFNFAELPENAWKADRLKLDFYCVKTDTLLHLTAAEAMDYLHVPSAAVIIKDDKIVFEHYSGGWSRDSQSCIFSVTKTITSLLCGIALTEGHIKSLSDYVTDYIPELKDADPMFAELKIEHLLDMTAGIKFNESYSWNPFSKIAKLYMGNNSLKTIKSLHFTHTPGENYSYDSATTAILGIVVERATGVPYAEYLSEKIWKPLGMERSAMIGVDDKRHRVAKSYAGLTTNVRDLAKIGRLFLNGGNWNSVQIVDSAFVKRCLSPHTAGMNGKEQGRYSYSWYWGFTDEAYKHGYFDTKEAMQTYYKEHPEAYMVSSHKNNNGGYTTVEYHERKYFNSVEALKAYYNEHPDKKVLKVWKNSIGYYAVLHNGGHWGFGLYGQVLYVNVEKNLIGIFLGADRLKDFTKVFDELCTKMY